MTGWTSTSIANFQSNSLASELLRPWELAAPEPPVSLQRSTFARYRQREGVVALSCAAAAYLVPPTAMLLGLAAAGPLGAALSALFGVVGWAWLMDHTGLLGNVRLRAELASRLGVAPGTADFVGIGLPENNTFVAKYLHPRLDSDDNVGFLSIRDDQLLLMTEEGQVQIAREDVRRISTERLVELPYLRWIKLEYYKGDKLTAVLVSSRESSTLTETRAATGALCSRLTAWWTEPISRELAERHPGAALLEMKRAA